MSELVERLASAGLRLSRARLAIAELVLGTDAHPTADQVWCQLRARGVVVSRATVYKALAAFAEAGLLRTLFIDGRQVFDPRLEPHHHAVDIETSEIRDLPAGALEVRGLEGLEGLEWVEHQVVVRARFFTPGARAPRTEPKPEKNQPPPQPEG